jgi:hypothetical protein
MRKGSNKRLREDAEEVHFNIFLPSPAQIRKQRAKEIEVYQRTRNSSTQAWGAGLAKESLVQRFKVVKQHTIGMSTDEKVLYSTPLFCFPILILSLSLPVVTLQSEDEKSPPVIATPEPSRSNHIVTNLFQQESHHHIDPGTYNSTPVVISPNDHLTRLSLATPPAAFVPARIDDGTPCASPIYSSFG